MEVRRMSSIRPMKLDEYQQLINVSLRKQPASVWFRDVHFLNVYTGQIDQANIYLSGSRIAYVGEKEPLTSEQTEIIELEKGQILVPGYIEPHAHPFQWYNPLTWGEYLLRQGTTTSINDNMSLFSKLNDDQALQFIDKLNKERSHLWLWWSRFDAQTGVGEQEGRFTDQTLQRWLAHPLVVQGGEFTSWPVLLKGDQKLARWMLMTKQDYKKRIEGHLPGASRETLNALTAAGVSADHEALNGEDVLNRLRLGLYATLRYSSIRPDLPLILKELRNQPNLNVSRIMLTNDGSMPFFVERSGCNSMIKFVMEAGFHAVDAYRMATLNPATYYGLDQDLGGIAPGRLAHFNVLEDLHDPTPLHVMAEGKWVIRDSQPEKASADDTPSSWVEEFFPPLQQTWEITSNTLAQEDGNVGIELMNEVITRPYLYEPEQELEENETYLTLVDRDGKWVLNTRLKGFATRLTAIASTYTASGDFLLIGKDREKMIEVLKEALHQGGGIVAYFEDGEQIHIPLPLSGGMSTATMDKLIELSQGFVQKMKKYGHRFNDPIYTLLFLTATHLPFVRLTKQGVLLIKEQQIVTKTHRIR
jgi:adenine deaminase